MATDFRLSYKGSGDDGTGGHAQWDDAVQWIVQGGRDFDTLTRWGLVGPPHMVYGGENEAVYAFRFNIDAPGGQIGGSVGTIKKLIMGILGYSSAPLVGHNINRTMPLRDPDRLGMVADRIVSVTYHGTSGYTPILAEAYGLPPFADDYFFKIPTDRSFGAGSDTGNPDQKAAALFNYVVITVKFCHVLYRVLSNSSIIQEKERYMFVQETPSIEYVQIPKAQVFWTEGDNANQAVADGGNQVRIIQTVTLTWSRLSWDVMTRLIPIWKGLLGTVNQTPLTLPIYNTTISYALETLLFMPYRTKPRLSPHGFPEWDVELNWAFRGGTFGGTDITWNKFLHPLGKYYGVAWKNGAANVKIYTPTDHDTFWQL